MTIKVYKPTSPARRKTSIIKEELTVREPEKSLIRIKKKKAGRNVSGKITVRHQGGGAKRFWRQVDFKQDKFNIPAQVVSLEYDPNRSAYLALVQYVDGEKRYILAPANLAVGEKVISSKERLEIKNGNRLPLKFIPTGLFVYNVELEPGKGGQIVRTAGNSAQLLALENGFAQLKLPSGEVRLIPEDCQASVGQISNPDYKNIRWGKAGRLRHLGIRPTVRGKAINPIDHPHGGGEGVQPIGLKHPKTPWGKPALGVKTRRSNKFSDRFILKRRK